MINLRLLICGLVASLGVIQSPQDLQELTRQARGTDPEARLEALEKLATLGSKSAPVWKALSDLIDIPTFRTDAFTMYYAIEALGEIGIASKPCIPTLRRVLRDRKVDSASQGHATNAIWKIRLQDPDAEVRVQAATNLGRSSQSAIPALQRALKDPDARVRAAAEQAIKQLQQ